MCLVSIKLFIVRTILCATVQTCTTITACSLFFSHNYSLFCSHPLRKQFLEGIKINAILQFSQKCFLIRISFAIFCSNCTLLKSYSENLLFRFNYGNWTRSRLKGRCIIGQQIWFQKTFANISEVDVEYRFLMVRLKFIAEINGSRPSNI